MANTGKYLSKLIAMLLCSAILLSTSVSAMADGDLILGLSGRLDSGTGNTIDLASSTEETGDGWEFDGTDTYTITGDVTVRGELTDATPLIFDIAGGKTLTWVADLSSETLDSYDALISVTGEGMFVMSDGQIVLLDQGITLMADDDIEIAVTGGDIMLIGSGTAIKSGGKVTVTEGASVQTEGESIAIDANDVEVAGGMVGAAGEDYDCVAIKAEGSVLITEGGYVFAQNAAAGTAIHAGGDVKITDESEIYVYASSGDGVGIQTEGNILVSGSSIDVYSDTDSRAIEAIGDVIITDGGTIEASSDSGECIGIKAGGDVLVSDSSVSTDSEIKSIAVDAGGDVAVNDYSSVTAWGATDDCIGIRSDAGVSITDGGRVSSNSQANGVAIQAEGDILVCDSTVQTSVSSPYGVAIRSNSPITIEILGDSSVTGSGGAILAKQASVTIGDLAYVRALALLAYLDGELLGNAIMAKDVTLKDYARVLAQNGAAIFYSDEISISGGAAFAMGDGIGGAVFEIDDQELELNHMLNVVFGMDNLEFTPGVEYMDSFSPEAAVAGDGIVIAWDYNSFYDKYIEFLDNLEAPYPYASDDTDDLIVYPDEEVECYWTIGRNGVNRVDYARGDNCDSFSGVISVGDDPHKPLKPNPKSNPGTTDPTDPGTTDPTDPGTTDPTDPGTTDPTDPGTTDPTDPGTTDPTDPGTTDPTDPGTTDPTDPGTTDPGTTDPGTTGSDDSDSDSDTSDRETDSDDSNAGGRTPNDRNTAITPTDTTPVSTNFPASPGTNTPGSNTDINNPTEADGIDDFSGLLTDEAGNYTFNLAENLAMSFRIDIPFDEFRDLMVDGVLWVRDQDYTARSGSTILTIDGSRLSQLSEGEHAIEAVFETQSVAITFMLINEPALSHEPSTADAAASVQDLLQDTAPLQPQTDISQITVAVSIVSILLIAAAALWWLKSGRRTKRSSER